MYSVIGEIEIDWRIVDRIYLAGVTIYIHYLSCLSIFPTASETERERERERHRQTKEREMEAKMIRKRKKEWSRMENENRTESMSTQHLII